MIDLHSHCYHSHDSKTPPRVMIERAIELGLEYIALTDHYDLDMLGWKGIVQLDLDKHFEELTALKQEYSDRIQLGVGVECGWAKQVEVDYAKSLAGYDFDMTINSVHIINGRDCYFKEYFDNLSQADAYAEYLDVIIDSLGAPYHFDSIGHLGYIMRYAPYDQPLWKLSDFGDKFDFILRTLIDKGVALEVNTHNKKRPFPFVPTIDLLTRYKELGGELITFGSDAHMPERIGDKFELVSDMLQSLGYKYIFKYLSHKPVAVKL